jgi:hypothetical protein
MMKNNAGIVLDILSPYLNVDTLTVDTAEPSIVSVCSVRIYYTCRVVLEGMEHEYFTRFAVSWTSWKHGG